MIAYVLKGASPSSVMDDPKARRIMSAGPWMAQPHAHGAMLTWKRDDGAPRDLSEFGEGRDTADGMIYLPPKTLPPFETLLNPAILRRDDAHVIRVVREEEVTLVRLIPAYSSPRKILENNTYGDYSTRYGKAVRLLLEKVSASPNTAFSEYAVDLFEACRLAIMHTHPRATRELITDYGIIDEDTVLEFWEGMLHVPKVSSPHGGGS